MTHLTELTWKPEGRQTVFILLGFGRGRITDVNRKVKKIRRGQAPPAKSPAGQLLDRASGELGTL